MKNNVKYQSMLVTETAYPIIYSTTSRCGHAWTTVSAYNAARLYGPKHQPIERNANYVVNSGQKDSRCFRKPLLHFP